MTFKFIPKLIMVVLASVCLPTTMMARDVEKHVHGTATFKIGHNSDMTLYEAEQRCIAEAKTEAMRAEFGELITSDIISSDEICNGVSSSSFAEYTMANVAAKWLEDTQEPVINASYSDGVLCFTAEVWGVATEIKHSPADAEYHIFNAGQRGSKTAKKETTEFYNRDALQLTFKAPANGYLCIYQRSKTDDKVFCLAPYGNTGAGRVEVKGGETLYFFDKKRNPDVAEMEQSTKNEIEYDELFVIYSPNPFVKCPDTPLGEGQMRVCTMNAFSKWLVNLMRNDIEVSVQKSILTIRNPQVSTY